MWWFEQGLCALPAALVVWTSAAFVFAYITAVVLRHVDPLLPYISDTGTMAPERCVFGIMLDVSAFLGVFTVYVRYKQVGALSSDSDSRLVALNRLGLFFGVVSSLGMCVVANFQVRVLVQTLVSFWMQPEVHSKTLFKTRLLLTLWTFCSIISMFVSSVVMYSSLPGVDVAQKLHWTPGETGYSAHLVSTVSEWSLAFSFISFFLTFIRDFQKIELRAEAVVHSPHLYDGPVGGAVHHREAGEESPLLGGGT
ncbi:DNA damage-regulated autophagy modulator protein 2b [Boleophthalmus pectinirostris]|uniref:DNA damage-regulated autophagy modulator protein 2b n=1 Tax=Boleophthalmus pectinirostris TaxID=150288 RepID=UPI00242BF151|nr:DNA damage-regulated autophagy modulator protein 2b [Boleophthalmus pectinirostris]